MTLKYDPPAYCDKCEWYACTDENGFTYCNFPGTEEEYQDFCPSWKHDMARDTQKGESK